MSSSTPVVTACASGVVSSLPSLLSLALPPRALEWPAHPLYPGPSVLQAPATTAKGWRWLESQGWEGPHIAQGCWVHGHCCCGWKLPGVGVSPQLAGWGPRPHCLCHLVAYGHGDCWGSEIGVMWCLPWRYSVFWDCRFSCCPWRLGIIIPIRPLLLVVPFLYVLVLTLICTDMWNSLASWGVGQRQFCWVMDVLLVLDGRGVAKGAIQPWCWRHPEPIYLAEETTRKNCENSKQFLLVDNYKIHKEWDELKTKPLSFQAEFRGNLKKPDSSDSKV